MMSNTIDTDIVMTGGGEHDDDVFRPLSGPRDNDTDFRMARIGADDDFSMDRIAERRLPACPGEDGQSDDADEYIVHDGVLYHDLKDTRRRNLATNCQRVVLYTEDGPFDHDSDEVFKGFGPTFVEFRKTLYERWEHFDPAVASDHWPRTMAPPTSPRSSATQFKASHALHVDPQVVPHHLQSLPQTPRYVPQRTPASHAQQLQASQASAQLSQYISEHSYQGQSIEPPGGVYPQLLMPPRSATISKDKLPYLFDVPASQRASMQYTVSLRENSRAPPWPSGLVRRCRWIPWQEDFLWKLIEFAMLLLNRHVMIKDYPAITEALHRYCRTTGPGIYAERGWNTVDSHVRKERKDDLAALIARIFP